jgi:DNA topoisomerase I
MSVRQWILRIGTPNPGHRYVTADGRPVRQRAVLARIAALRIPPAYRDVHIATSPRAAIQAWGFDAKGRKQYRYHPRAVARGALRKFHRIARMGLDLPVIRTRIAADLKAEGFSRRRVSAAVVRLIAEGYLRVGNERYERENKSHGAATLRKSHVTVEADRVLLHFRGKRGIPQRHVIADRRLAAFIMALRATPGIHLFRYQTDDGWCDLTARDVNRYLHDLVRVPYTAKDFRTWGGTLRCAVSLAVFGPAPSERLAKHNVVLAIRAVAEELGNTPAISRKSYVHPIVIAQYLDHGSTIAPYLTGRCRRLARCTQEEAALSAFLQEHFPERRRRPRQDVAA